MNGQKEQMADSRVTLIKAVLGLVALAALVGGYLLYSNNKEYSQSKAPAGEVVVNFPKEFLLEKGVAVSESYSLDYSRSNLKQPVVEYISALNMTQNVVSFGGYLRKNGWTISREADPLKSSTFFYASKEKNEVNITFSTEAGKVKVVISYLVRG